jgi:hypothetical protein
MAIPRNSLSALDGFDRGVDVDDLLSRANGRLFNWLVGGSFLAGHMALFGTVFLGAFAWNLGRTPNDLSALGAFRVWSVLLVAHLVITGGFQIAARILGWNAPTWTTTVAAPARNTQRSERQPVPAMVWARGLESASRVNATARRWASTSARSASERLPDPDDQAWPEQPAIARVDSGPDRGDVTWPESAPRSTMLSANQTDHVVSVDHASDQPKDSALTWLEGFVESRTKDREQRWSWVEAAAASWLSRRDTPGSTPADVATSHVVDDGVVEPDADSQQPTA